MGTKAEAVKILKQFSSDCELEYINAGENTEAIIKTTEDRPWVNTGDSDDISIYYEVGTSKTAFWDDVIAQVELSTGQD